MSSAVLAFVTRRDEQLWIRLERWRAPRFVRLYLLGSTRLGDGWLWFLTALLLSGGGSRAHRVLAAAAVCAGSANASIVLLKRRFRRARPSDGVTNPLFHLACDRSSFPSGHATNAFALGTMLALAFPPLGPTAGLLAASIALSRVVLGRHFLSDVLVGALLGSLIGAVSYLTIVL
jgi:undecaprenyl-diphosphatase